MPRLSWQASGAQHTEGRGEIEVLGRPVLEQPTALADRDSCRALVDAAVACFGHVEILVQNGHYDGDYKVVTDSDPQSWRDIMEVNLFGAFRLAQFVVPSMQERGGTAG